MAQAYDTAEARYRPVASIYSAPMTEKPPTRGPLQTVRLGVLGLGAVAQAVHLPLIDRLHEHFAIAALADLSPSLGATIGDRYRAIA